MMSMLSHNFLVVLSHGLRLLNNHNKINRFTRRMEAMVCCFIQVVEFFKIRSLKSEVNLLFLE